MNHISAFDIDAASQFEEHKAARHASVLIHRRATEHFGSFIDGAGSLAERVARLDLISADLKRLVQDTCEECGHADVEAVYASVEEHLGGGAFCDDCRKWKSGPKAGTCECDSKREKPEDEQSDDTEKTALFDGGHVGSMKWRRAADDSLGGDGTPSPKIDTKTWKPNALNDSGNLKPIDTDGGPYSTVSQDVAEPADHSKPFLEQTDAAAKHDQKLDKADGTGDGAHTDTWSGMSGLADAVTSHFFSDAQIDSLLQ